MADGLLLRIDPAVRESLPPQLAAAGAALAAGCTEDEAAELADDLPLLYYHLARLESRGLVSRVLRVGAGEAAELLPLVPGARFPDTMPAFSTLRLSRFALLRREGDFPVLESPRSPFRLLVRDGKLLPLLAQLAQETAPGDFSASCAAAGLSDEGAAALLRLLHAAGGLQEEEGESLRQWDFHSLLFHARSRRGRWRNDFLPFLGAIPPLPALKEPPSSREPIFLGPAPPPRDVPFHRVLDCRRSLREPGERPLPLEKLAEVLYRAARVTYARSASPELGHHYDVAARPYPCAGACYELELYAAVHRCDSLEPALYWYDPAGHALRRAGENPRALEALLAEASASAGGKHPPDCLLVITARFPRVLWKYGGLGYSLILKDVGVLMQTVSLCAEAAGLGACILGCGDSLVMADAAGLDPDAETSVGEIILWGEQRGEPLRAGCVAAG